MNSLKLLVLFSFFTIASFGQGSDCDSVFIQCCSYNTITNNDITIEVSNSSSDIFSYPGFILFDSNNDTLAIETVNYYGIGNYPQPHTMEFTAPFSLPFEGYIELHSGFFTYYECTFPITIPDTTLTTINNFLIPDLIVFPNPANSFVNIQSDKTIQSYELLDIYGNIQLSQYSKNQNMIKVNIEELKPGTYFVKVITETGISTKRILISR